MYYTLFRFGLEPPPTALGPSLLIEEFGFKEFGSKCSKEITFQE
jgi:hypothetical protein